MSLNLTLVLTSELNPNFLRHRNICIDFPLQETLTLDQAILTEQQPSESTSVIPPHNPEAHSVELDQNSNCQSICPILLTLQLMLNLALSPGSVTSPSSLMSPTFQLKLETQSCTRPQNRDRSEVLL